MDKVLKNEEISQFFGFGKTKMSKLFQEKVLPVVKIGNDYVTTERTIEEWIKENVGKEIYY